MNITSNGAYIQSVESIGFPSFSNHTISFMDSSGLNIIMNNRDVMRLYAVIECELRRDCKSIEGYWETIK